MAIQSLNIANNKILSKSNCAINNSQTSINRSSKANFTSDKSSISNKSRKSKKANDFKSPYLTGANFQLCSRANEKLSLKKKKNFVSSFSLASSIYKANSDEFKILKRRKKEKIKKSVLTLPNIPLHIPQTCTVSDMNDSEYNDSDYNSQKCKVKKKRGVRNVMKPKIKGKGNESLKDNFRKSSTLNIDLVPLYGDGKPNIKKVTCKNKVKKCDHIQPGDIWTMLKNMNRFEYVPSPPSSEESVATITTKQTKDTRISEICNTEVPLFSKLGENSGSKSILSQTSSVDRITVVDNEINKVDEELKNKVSNDHTTVKKRNNNMLKQKRKMLKLTKCHEHENKKADNINIQCDSFDKRFNCENSLQDLHSSVLNLGIKNEAMNDAKDVELKRSLDAYNRITGKSNKAPISNSLQENKVVISINKVTTDNKSKHATNGTKEAKLCKTVNNGLIPKEDNKRTTQKSAITKSRFNSSNVTQAYIKRKLSNIKFPIVILGIDQLSSTMQVDNNGFSQFNGLDEHIWPFMLEWSVKKQSEVLFNDTLKTSQINHLKNNCTIPLVHTQESAKYLNRKESDINLLNKVDIKIMPKNLQNNSNEYLQSSNENVNLPTVVAKPKPMQHFKEKMMEFIYKKSSKSSVENYMQKRESCKKKIFENVKISKHVDGCTEMHKLDHHFSKLSAKSVVKECSVRPILVKKAPSANKYSWAKAKWASDFIDNVMKKIKKGVYYNQELYNAKNRSLQKTIDVSLQTELSEEMHVSEVSSQDSNFNMFALAAKNANYDVDIAIPGFNDPLPPLEIKMLTRTQIAIKHSLTHVVLQFDVTTPIGPEYLMTSKSSTTNLPIATTETFSKVLKYKTTIVNAILPAELCDILPKLMGKSFNNVNEPAVCNKTKDCYAVSNPCNKNFGIIKHSSIIAQKLQKGYFQKLNYDKQPHKISHEMVLHKITCLLNFKSETLSQFHPELYYASKNPMFFTSGIKEIRHVKHNTLMVYENQSINKCKALLPYVPPILLLKSTFKRCILSENALKDSDFNVKLDLKFCTQEQQNNISVVCNMNKRIHIQKLNNFFKDFIFDRRFINNSCKNVESSNKHSNILQITYDPLKTFEHVNKNREEKIQSNDINEYGTLNDKFSNKSKKCSKRSYKKSNSMTSISKDRTTSLNKITNLDDFFQSFGTCKLLSGVLEGASGKRVMSSLLEMRSWIKEITPKQALLILLLANKKETTNLKRFRPIILQGIAVNRITCATDLDMEVEVIERENICISQYEGISFLPKLNDKNLLDELNWIAKTTVRSFIF